MKAIVVSAGGVEVADVAQPVPGPAEVLVRVHSASLNRADLQVASGRKHGSSGGLGPTVGIELAGTVAAVGSAAGAAGVAVGDAVMASGRGGYAEYAVADWGRVYRLPRGLDFADGCVLPVALQTAHDALVGNGKLVRGETVLVHGATSGVGLMTMQVARHLGAGRVIGTSTSDERAARLPDFGAHIALVTSDASWPDQVLEATAGAGADLVVDFVAGETINATMRATALGGRIVNVGRLAGFHGDFDFDLHSLRRIRYLGATFRTRSAEDVRVIAAGVRADLWPAVVAGALRLPVSRRFPLQEAAAALAHMRENAHFGKVVLDVLPPT